MESKRMKSCGKNIWIVQGPSVSFFGVPYPTRMVVVKLDGDDPQEEAPVAWLWSPVAWSRELQQEIETTIGGRIRYLVSPNKIHWLFLKEWKDHVPDAQLVSSPGLAQRKIAADFQLDIDPFDGTPGEKTSILPTTITKHIDHVVLEGAFLQEVAYFHKASKTVLICDYIQRFAAEDMPGNRCMAWLMHADGLAGPQGTAPGELRLATKFVPWRMQSLQAAVDKVIEGWQPRQLIIAHGQCVLLADHEYDDDDDLDEDEAIEALAAGFSWILNYKQGKDFGCGAPRPAYVA